MSETKSLVKRDADRTPEFVLKQLETIEGVMTYAKVLLDSGLAPKHFDGKPEAVVITIQHGLQLGMSISQALQQIVPINGLLSIKGDGGLALVMASGLVGEWKEEKSGKIGDGTYEVKITATRKDNGRTETAEFSVAKAKHAGLWIDKEAVRRDSKKGYKPWYTYPDRMIRYRALGFLLRDLFPDVLQGMVVYEEAIDYPTENKTTIQDSEGNNVAFTTHEDRPSSEAVQEAVAQAEQRSNEKSGKEVEDAQIAEDEPPSDTTPSNEWPEDWHVYTYLELYNIGSARPLEPVMKERDLIDRIPKEEGIKHTNKLYRNIILDHQEEYGIVDPDRKDEKETKKPEPPAQKPKPKKEAEKPDVPPHEEEIEEEPQTEMPLEVPEKKLSAAALKKQDEEINFLMADMCEVPDGGRDMQQSIRVYNGMGEVGIDRKNFHDTLKISGLDGKFEDVNTFTAKATLNEIKDLMSAAIRNSK